MRLYPSARSRTGCRACRFTHQRIRVGARYSSSRLTGRLRSTTFMIGSVAPREPKFLSSDSCTPQRTGQIERHGLVHACSGYRSDARRFHDPRLLDRRLAQARADRTLNDIRRDQGWLTPDSQAVRSPHSRASQRLAGVPGGGNGCNEFRSQPDGSSSSRSTA
jgi:hypothetical protein